MIIGLTGLARSGKDTFFEFAKSFFISNNFNINNIKKYAFADALKMECKDFIFNNSGINVLNPTEDEKKKIRPLLVAYGTHLKRAINPNCWIEKISKNVIDEHNNGNIVFITDVRYPNEAQWIQDQGGSIIHISRINNSSANTEESINDPIIKKMTCLHFSWESFKDGATDPLSMVTSFFNKNFQTERILQHERQATNNEYKK